MSIVFLRRETKLLAFGFARGVHWSSKSEGKNGPEALTRLKSRADLNTPLKSEPSSLSHVPHSVLPSTVSSL